MLRWLQRDKRTRAPQTPAPAAPEQTVFPLEAVLGAFRSVIDAAQSAHQAEIAALRAEIAAVRAVVDAHEERAAHLVTRFNSLQGLVNRKIGGVEPAEQRGPPVVLLGGANGGR